MMIYGLSGEMYARELTAKAQGKMRTAELAALAGLAEFFLFFFLFLCHVGAS